MYETAGGMCAYAMGLVVCKMYNRTVCAFIIFFLSTLFAYLVVKCCVAQNLFFVTGDQAGSTNFGVNCLSHLVMRC